MADCSNWPRRRCFGFCWNWEWLNCRKWSQVAQNPNQHLFYDFCAFLQPIQIDLHWRGFIPNHYFVTAQKNFIWGGLVILLFLGALFWAKEQDPFSRKWFTLKTVDHGSVKCVAVLPKPLRQYPVVIYAHGSGGSLLNDGNDLRQMAELGLVAVSLEYDQTNEGAFTAQFEALLRYIGRQKWTDTNAIAWVGFSLGANRMLDFALQHPKQQPQLLVQLSGAGVNQPLTLNSQLSTDLRCPVLFVHGEQDEIFL